MDPKGIKGRPITDKRPYLRGLPVNDDFQNLWDQYGKAKTSVRQIEYRLEDAERRQQILGEMPEFSVEVDVDRVPRYQLEASSDVGNSALVDKYGRSQYLKAKSSRESIKSDYKNEDEEIVVSGGRQRSPLREPNFEYLAKPSRDSQKKYVSYGAGLDGTGYTTGIGEAWKSKSASSHNQTDSLALRETDIKFLNEDIPMKDRYGKKDKRSVKFTHLDVQVPGQKAVSAHQLVTEPKQRSAPLPEEVNATYTVTGGSGDTKSMRKKLQKGLQSLDSDLGGLSRLREKIRQQRLNASSSSKDEEDEVGPSFSNGNLANEIPPSNPKSLHNDGDIVQGYDYELYTKEKPVMTRKVAAGPPGPTYRGFNETETRYQTSDGKIHKASESKKKAKEKKPTRITKKMHDPNEHPHDAEVEKQRKSARVVASKKPSRPDRREMITTTSWRAGQKVIMQELGMTAAKKMPSKKEPQTLQDLDENDDSHYEPPPVAPPVEHRDEESQAVLEKAKSLSEEAKAVLNDLHSDHSEDDEKDITMEDMTQKKRKRPKITHSEIDKQDKAAKVRHYDADDVRKYIVKQKADRKKKEEQDKDSKKKSEEAKRKQLQELYKKQKGSAKVPGKNTGKSEPKQRQNYGKNIEDWPERNPYHTEKTRSNNGSDKENQRADSGSSDSSTMTFQSLKSGSGGSNERKEKERRKKPEKDVPSRNLRQEGTNDSGLGLTGDNVLKKYTQESGLNTEDIISRFSKQAEAIKRKYIPDDPRIASEMNPYSSLPPPDHLRRDAGRNFSASTGADPLQYKKQQRIKAITETVASLQSRLHQETKRIQEFTPASSDRWAYPPESEEKDFVSRYDRMTGSKEDYSVFQKDLPGIANLADKALQGIHDRDQKKAATKIQAAYRGHAVRQSLHWDEEQNHRPSKPYKRELALGSHEDLSDISVHSDLTLTEVSDHEKYGKSSTNGFHSHGRKQDYRSLKLDDDYKIAFQPKSYKWDEPEADPFSVLNVYARKMKQGEKLRKYQTEDYSPNDEISEGSITQSTDKSPAVSYSEDFTMSHHSRSLSPRSARSRHKEDYVPVSTHHSKPLFSRSDTATTERGSGKLTTMISKHDRSPEKDDSLDETITPLDSENEDDGLEEGVITDDDNEEESPDTHSRDKALSEPAYSKSLVLSSKHKSHTHDDSLESDLSSLGEEKSEDPMAKYTRPTGAVPVHMNIGPVPTQGASHLSPGSLGRRLTAELHLLDGVEVSMRQITDVERTRAVSLAQQETVSLAQILKARQQAHDFDMKSLQLKAKQEVVETSKQIEDARRSAAEAAHNAAQAIAEARLASTSNHMQESTIKLIETQTQAAKATAEAARQLAEAKISVDQGNTALDQREKNQQLVKDAAASAAVAAVNAVMDKGFKSPKKSSYKLSTDSNSKGDTLFSTTSPDLSKTSLSDSFESTMTETPPTTKKSTAREERPRKKATTSEIITDSELSLSPDKQLDSVRSQSIRTDSGLKEESKSSGSIKTESGAHDPSSPNNSIAEEVQSEKGDDYSIDFDSSVTEDMDKSLREVLPSEGHRKKLKKESSQTDLTHSFSSDDFHVAAAAAGISTTHASRRLSFEEDSYTRFTVDMVKQYMREEETRAQHQHALLKLRERALKEKTKAELAWLEQQKQRTRNKGADDNYPQIKKRQRGLLIKLQQEQAEIKRLQEANKAARKERQVLLKQTQELARLRQSTQQVLRQLRKKNTSHLEEWWAALESSNDESCSQVREKLKRSSSPPVTGHKLAVNASQDEETLMHLDDTSEFSAPASPIKDVKSDSELYSESVGDRSLGPSASDTTVLQKLRKMKLDEKYLTTREQKLRHRRKNAEELLAWKERLDEEEARIRNLENVALTVVDKKNKGDKSKERGTAKLEQKKSSKAPLISPRNLPTRAHRSESDILSSKSDSRGRKASETASITEDITESSIQTEKKRLRSASESSIAEDVISDTKHFSRGSSVPEEITAPPGSTIADEILTERKTQDSSDDTIVNSSVQEDYSNETFESPTDQTTITSKQPTQSSPTSKLSRVAKETSLALAKSPRSPFTSPGRKGSESESEDSYSMTYSETASDQSDVETRIRALNEELKRRKHEADKLKKEQKKRHKERLKVQEASLKKQIEAYDTYITQVKTELSTDETEPNKNAGVKPKIKQPGESKKLQKTDIIKPQDASGKERLGSTSSLEDMGQESEKPVVRRQVSFESITEDTAQKGKTAEKNEDEITEDIPQPESEVTDKSELKLDLGSDDSEDEDSQKMPVSALDTGRSVTEMIETESILTGRSETEGKTSARSVNTDGPVSEKVYSSIQEETEVSYTDATTPRTGRSDYSTDFSEQSKSVSKSVKTEKDSVKESVPQDSIQESIIDESIHESIEESVKKSIDESVKRSIDESVKKSSEESLKKSIEDKVETQEEKSTTKKEEDDKQSISESLSHASEKDKSDKSYSYSESKSTVTKDSYSDDYSGSTTSEKTATPSVKKEDEDKTPQNEKKESVVESIHTDQDISEISDISDDMLPLEGKGKEDEEGDKPLFDFTEDKGEKLSKEEISEKSVKEAAISEKSVKEDKPEIDLLAEFNIGERVLVGGVQPGTLRFKGKTSFAEGFWGGIELDTAEGRNDGSKDGIQYFTCEPNFGIFAPPEKISLLPKESKDDGDKEDRVADTQMPSYKEDFDDNSESHSDDETVSKDITESRGQSSRRSSITEDISVSSELDRVISSAAEAVEKFGEKPPTSTSPVDTISSEGLTPRDEDATKEEVKETVPAVKTKPSEQLVDNITNNLTEMIVRDTMDTIGKISTKEPSVPKEDIVAPPPSSDIPAEPEVVAPDSSQTKKEHAVESAAENLLNEAISQMLTIKKKRQEKLQTQAEENSQPKDSKNKSPEKEIVTDSKVTSESETVKETKPIEKETSFLGDLPQLIPRPVSPLGFEEPPKVAKDDLDLLYDEIGLLGGDDGDDWWEDGIGFGSNTKQAPPYPNKDSDKFGVDNRQGLKIDLQKLTEELFYAVPNKKEQVNELVESAVDVFWEKRRYGESWEDVTPPKEYLICDGNGTDLEGKSRKVYRKLVFDLTSEILRDMYREEEEPEPPLWCKPKRVRKKYHKERNPPTTVDVLRPIVQESIHAYVGLDAKTLQSKKGHKWGGRKKKDHVDSILVQELREEEPDWVNYDEDELAVKMHLADSIFDSLLTETANVIMAISDKKSASS